MEDEDQGMPRSYEYYIKVVPTQFQSLKGEMHHSYQYVANSNHIIGRFQLPAIYFRYDMSPITVRTKQTETREKYIYDITYMTCLLRQIL